MKVPLSFVSKLKKDQIILLLQLWQNGYSIRIRNRAHGILLSSKGYNIDEISDILDVHRNTVSSWITAKGTCWKKFAV